MSDKSISVSLKNVGLHSYLYVSCYCDDGRAERSIGEKCTPSEYENKTFNKDAKRKIADIEAGVEIHFSYCKMGRKRFLKKDVLNIIKQCASRTGKAAGMTVSNALGRYAEALRAGKELRGGKKANTSTINNVVFAKKLLDEHTKLGHIGIEEYSQGDHNRLIKALLDQEYAQNTLALYSNAIILFFKYTYKSWHTNTIFKEDDIYQAKDVIDHAVYYKTSEIMQLYKLPLTGMRERVRDMFVYGCFTCMRYSDHKAHSEVNIDDKYIILNTKKTGKSVAIPLHPVVRELLAKYGGSPPKVDVSHFNPTLKDICKEAVDADGKYLFHDTVAFSRIEGGKPNNKTVFRYELTSSHTMRRSFVTNALLAGMPDDYIKRIGGWKSDAAFNKYKRATDIDVANVAAAHPFFADFKIG